jgi:phytoene desaturase
MSKKNVIVIGAGPGGLTSAMLLQNKGYNVKLFEKADRVGGRNALIELNDYKFDTGPTFLMMSFVLHEMFQAVGRKTEDYLKLIALEPMYKLHFPKFSLDIKTDLKDMKDDVAKIFPGEEKGLEKFMKVEAVRYERMYNCLKKHYSDFSRFFSEDFLKALPYMAVGKTLFQNLGNYFESEELRLAFTFQSKYLGMSPRPPLPLSLTLNIKKKYSTS